MKDVKRRAYESVLRTRDYGLGSAADFSANSFGAQLFADLNTEVDNLTQLAEILTSKRSASKQSTSSKAAARAVLVEDMEVISRTARVIAINIPGLAERFRLPYSSGDQAWLSAARAFASDAVAYKDEFIKFGLPADFIETLLVDIAAFEAAEAEQHNSTSASVAATQAFEAGLERALNLRRQLDVVVRNKHRNDSAKLAAWLSASRIERAPKRKQKAAKPADAPAN